MLDVKFSVSFLLFHGNDALHMFLWLEESENMHWFNLTLLNAYVHVRWVHLNWEPDYRNFLLPACLCICVHTNLHPNSQSKYLTLAEPGTANFPLLSQRREEQRSGWCWREEAWSCHGKSSQVRSYISSRPFFLFLGTQTVQCCLNDLICGGANENKQAWPW